MSGRRVPARRRRVGRADSRSVCADAAEVAVSGLLGRVGAFFFEAAESPAPALARSRPLPASRRFGPRCSVRPRWSCRSPRPAPVSCARAGAPRRADLHLASGERARARPRGARRALAGRRDDARRAAARGATRRRRARRDRVRPPGVARARPRSVRGRPRSSCAACAAAGAPARARGRRCATRAVRAAARRRSTSASPCCRRTPTRRCASSRSQRLPTRARAAVAAAAAGPAALGGDGRPRAPALAARGRTVSRRRRRWPVTHASRSLPEVGP